MMLVYASEKAMNFEAKALAANLEVCGVLPYLKIS